MFGPSGESDCRSLRHSDRDDHHLPFFVANFLTGYNLTIIMRALAFAGIVALGQCLLSHSGELDLSIGAIAGLCAVVGGMFMVQAKLDPFLAFGICLCWGSSADLSMGSLSRVYG